MGELRACMAARCRCTASRLPPNACIPAEYKRAIARLAASLTASGQTLFLDAGSTTSVLADELARQSGLTIITNSFDVAENRRRGQRRQ